MSDLNTLDISKLSSKELEGMIAQLNEAKIERDKQDRISDLSYVREKIKKHGITVTQLKGYLVTRRRKVKVDDLELCKLDELVEIQTALPTLISNAKKRQDLKDAKASSRKKKKDAPVTSNAVPTK